MAEPDRPATKNHEIFYFGMDSHVLHGDFRIKIAVSLLKIRLENMVHVNWCDKNG